MEIRNIALSMIDNFEKRPVVTQGEYNLSFGDGKYKGELLNGEPHGYGEAKYKNMTYEGHWKECLRHGYGVEIYESGNLFEGNFSHGRRCGYGVLYYADGSQDAGQWLGNKLSGYGRR